MQENDVFGEQRNNEAELQPRTNNNSTANDTSLPPDSEDLYLNDSPPESYDAVYNGMTSGSNGDGSAPRTENLDNEPMTAAAASSSSSFSYPVILQTLLDDEDIVVGSGDQVNVDSAEVEHKPEGTKPEIKNMERNEPEPEIQEQEVEEEFGDDEEEYEVVENTSDILGYFKDVPRKHWSCCMLGKLAGEKGFHCHASFYAARISERNSNRAHNNKMLFHGKNSNPHWGMDIMVTFERCVAHHAEEFHKCCYASAIEKKERHKWHYYRNQRHLIGSQEEEESSSAEPINELEMMVHRRGQKTSLDRHKFSPRTSLQMEPEIAITQTGSWNYEPSEPIRTRNNERTRRGRKRNQSRRRRNHKRHRGT